jgi:drug/metabolite transporter (DMT)-like permease
MITAYLSDKTRRRWPYLLFSFIVALSGVIALFKLPQGQNDARYGALVLYTMGVFSAVPIIICWYLMNLEGHRDRAVGSAWQIEFGNCAGIISTFAFPVRDRPTYRLGYSLGIGLLSVSFASSIVYFVLVTLENRKRGPGQKKLIL